MSNSNPDHQNTPGAPPQPQSQHQPSYVAAPPVYERPTAAQPAAGSPSPTALAYTNTFALLSFVFAFLSPVVAVILGHMGLSQIKRNGDAGRGLGLAGLIIGYVFLAFFLLFIAFYISVIGFMFTMLSEEMSQAA